MHVQGNELEGGIPIEGDDLFVCQAGFVIQDLEIDGETSGCQASLDCVVGGNAMAVALGLEDLL
jgi:hypothetical protein